MYTDIVVVHRYCSCTQIL